jgi:ABC-type multidrug transport system fused ATPase/permease subunit
MPSRHRRTLSLVRERVTQRGAQWVGAALIVLVAIVFAITNVWPFDASPPKLPADPTIWQLMLSDDTTLGFVRLGLVLLTVFVVASVPALIIGGRWLKGFGTKGLTADDAADASQALDDAKAKLDDTAHQLEVIKQERDEALELVRRVLGSGT